MDRKKFFKKISLAFAGLAIIGGSAFNIFKGKHSAKSNPVEVKINKLAVRRERTGLKNV